MVGNLGSGKKLPRIPESKRHRIPDPDPQHCNGNDDGDLLFLYGVAPTPPAMEKPRPDVSRSRVVYIFSTFARKDFLN
jgi:hypothetical protein